MDAALNEQLNSIQTASQADSILLADKNGLCLATRGGIRSSGSGYVRSLINHASVLGAEPTIVIETESSTIFVHDEAGIATAIVKSL